MALRQCEIEGTLVVVRALLWIGVVRQKEREYFHISILRGGVEGCPAAVLACIGVGASGQKDGDGATVPSSGGSVQRFVLHGVARPRMNIRALLQQDHRTPRVAEEGGEMQGRPAIVAVGTGL